MYANTIVLSDPDKLLPKVLQWVATLGLGDKLDA